MQKDSRSAKANATATKGNKRLLDFFLYILIALIVATGIHNPIAFSIRDIMENRENEAQIARWQEQYDEYILYADDSVELKFLECLEMEIELSHNDFSDELEEEKAQLLERIRSRIDEIESEDVQ